MSEFENQENEVNQETQQPEQPQQERTAQYQAPAAAGKSSTGLDENIAGLLCYLGSFITAIIFLVLEKESKFVKFHAFQSLFFSITLLVLRLVIGFIPFIGLLLVLLVNIGGLVLYVLLMVKAYQKETFKLPILGDLAEKQVNQ